MAIKNITDQTFDQEIASGTVLVDFWAAWCGPCRMLGPVLDEIDAEAGNKLSIKKINADDNPEIMTRYGVMGLPTMILFKDGKLVERFSGFRPKPQIMSILNKHI